MIAFERRTFDYAAVGERLGDIRRAVQTGEEDQEGLGGRGRREWRAKILVSVSKLPVCGSCEVRLRRGKVRS